MPSSGSLTGIQSPFWVKDRNDGRYLGPESRADIQKRTGELEAARAQVRPLSYSLGIQDGGLRYGPYPGIQDVQIYIRGSYSQPGRRVRRHFPEVLAGNQPPTIAEGSGRTELARWIARPDNPLPARVMVNRIWQHHFGEGLVRTPSNFGRRGEPPTHPELLDWLARRFVGSGWSVKVHAPADHALGRLPAVEPGTRRAPRGRPGEPPLGPDEPAPARGRRDP